MNRLDEQVELSQIGQSQQHRHYEHYVDHRYRADSRDRNPAPRERTFSSSFSPRPSAPTPGAAEMTSGTDQEAI